MGHDASQPLLAGAVGTVGAVGPSLATAAAPPVAARRATASAGATSMRRADLRVLRRPDDVVFPKSELSIPSPSLCASPETDAPVSVLFGRKFALDGSGSCILHS